MRQKSIILTNCLGLSRYQSCPFYPPLFFCLLHYWQGTKKYPLNESNMLLLKSVESSHRDECLSTADLADLISVTCKVMEHGKAMNVIPYLSLAVHSQRRAGTGSRGLLFA